MSRYLSVTLGILTAIGGFVDTRGRREVRIPWEHVREVGPDVRLNIPADATGATTTADTGQVGKPLLASRSLASPREGMP